MLYLGHKLGIQPSLTVIQNLKWLLGITTLKTYSQVQILSTLEKMGLKGLENTVCEHLSKGQYQRLALARLWLDPPQYWILDEPMTALDEMGVELLYKRILSHLVEGGLLVMASHRPFHLNSGAQINKIEIMVDREKRC
jgi:heme exporter protein A